MLLAVEIGISNDVLMLARGSLRLDMALLGICAGAITFPDKFAEWIHDLLNRYVGRNGVIAIIGLGVVGAGLVALTFERIGWLDVVGVVTVCLFVRLLLAVLMNVFGFREW